MATLRAPTNADAPALSRLLAELGYPADAEEIPARLKALQGHPGAVAVVAEVHGRVVGLATVHVIPSIHMSAPVAWLTTLVVSEGARGSGVGRELVAHAEAFAAARGASKISLTSALHRDRAHSFYKSLGYEQTGVRLATPAAGGVGPAPRSRRWWWRPSPCPMRSVRPAAAGPSCCAVSSRSTHSGAPAVATRCASLPSLPSPR